MCKNSMTLLLYQWKNKKYEAHYKARALFLN